MGKSNIYWVFFCCLLLCGCNVEEKLTPFDPEKDWMEIAKPLTDDPVDLLRYDIYEKYKISVFYNDTLGSENRLDMLGREYLHWELLKVFYAPGHVKPDGEYILLDDYSILEPILEYFKNNVFDRFVYAEKLPALLFVDTLWNSANIYFRSQIDTYVGYNTMVITTESDFDELTDAQKMEYAYVFLRDFLKSRLLLEEYNDWRNSFFNESISMNPLCESIYSSSLSSGTSLEVAFAGTNFTHKEELGFVTSIMIDSYNGSYEATPTKDMDIESYVDLVLRYNSEKIEDIYANYSVVKKKFYMVKNKLEEWGYKTLD